MIAMQIPLFSLLACVAALVAGPAKAQDQSIYWHGDYREALRQARQTRKPIFLEFRCEA
jgi:hypothetical protein